MHPAVHVQGRRRFRPVRGERDHVRRRLKTGRHFIGIDVNEEYVKMAEDRIRHCLHELSQRSISDFV